MIYTQIKPINFPTKGTGKFIVVESKNYVLGGSVADFYYRILDNVDFSPTPLEGQEITSGVLTMNDSELNQWGNNDNYPIDWVINNLGLEKIIIK